MRTSMHRRPRLPSKSESFITEYMDFLVVLQSRASQSVVDSLCLCVQLLKASRGGITLFWLTNLRGAANIVSVVLVVSFTTIVVSKKSGTSIWKINVGFGFVFGLICNSVNWRFASISPGKLSEVPYG